MCAEPRIKSPVTRVILIYHMDDDQTRNHPGRKRLPPDEMAWFVQKAVGDGWVGFTRVDQHAGGNTQFQNTVLMAALKDFNNGQELIDLFRNLPWTQPAELWLKEDIETLFTRYLPESAAVVPQSDDSFEVVVIGEEG